jgi:hypothetical protein
MDKSGIEKEIASIAGDIKKMFENNLPAGSSKPTEIAAELYKKIAVWEYLQSTVVTEPATKNEIIEEQIHETSIQTEQIITEETEPEIIPEPVVEPIVDIQVQAIPEKAEEPQPVPTEIKAIPAVDIKKHVGFNDKFEFINELFKGNSANYETCVSQLNTATSLKQALGTFYNFKTAYGWADDNESAAKLQEIIQIAFK